ncbi:nucleotide disphospho-sugar-binding domain-containing protein [Amycolatopsis magusensis]|uniref:UDP:flavonoid glycosyltransferase YjiC (YdhE family) n=1 Tax=Amycolatopsis magusensis TaxID=882444 RepID=A0ABS4PNS7_9PSEU|nr:nucleotide disphospho-sugar-binding domain-containing protein [Amycolatopsis magusensis]MBP2181096.1 UDP:flavonoid glycosyltransferase YjiC (YdhE family) [Amycolatopsis magusensis]MDI5981820.1 DUF1205 domain-containing protein [Amycolatopsis magusensis]
MRVLVTGFPHVTHLNHLIPHAQALQAEGHEVVVACPPGAEEQIVAAGLPAVKTGEPEPHSLQNWAKYGLLPSPEEMEELAVKLDLSGDERDNWDAYYQFFLFSARYYLPPEPREDIDNLIAFAKQWQPDLVLWESWFPCGGVVAKAAGAASGRVLNGPDYGGWAIEKFAERVAEGHETPVNPLEISLRALADRHGVDVDDDVLLGHFTIDAIPAESMRLSRNISTVPVRWVPYNGGSVLPEWLHERPQRPRVALTVGVSTRAYHEGVDLIPKVFEAIEGLDIEVIGTFNENQLVGAPPVPENLRVVDYVPLTSLLPTCVAAIHHGGSGSFVATLAAGIPHVIADTEEPQRMVFSGEGESISVTVTERSVDAWLTARLVKETGAGVQINRITQSAAEIRAALLAVLNDPSYADAAKSMHDAWLARPTPAGIIPDLEKLTEFHRPTR